MFYSLPMKNFSKMRENMVDCQIHTSSVVDEAVLSAFSTVPRELFVPERLQNVCYLDEDVDIGQGRYLISPMVHAKMLQDVGVNPEDVVLDIGAGYGYSSAILSMLATTVIVVENNKRQCEKAKRVWESLDLRNIVLVDNDLTKGAPDHAPYSLIIINGAVSSVPNTLLAQLGHGGRLVTVIQDPGAAFGHATLFVKDETGDVSSRVIFEASVPVLNAFSAAPAFVF